MGFIFVGKEDKSFKQGLDRIGAVLSEYQFSDQESGLNSREGEVDRPVVRPF